MLLLAVLVIGSVGLAVWAVRSVFHTTATEVSFGPLPSKTSAAGQRTSPEPGALAPVFEVPGYDGRGPVRLAAFRGRLVVLNFWTSWCPPCRAEASTLESIYLTYQDRGVVFLGVDLQNDTWEESRAFLRRYHITYPVGRDESGAVGRAYRVTAIPTTYFVGPDGRILTPPLTGGFIGERGARELVIEIETWLSATALRPSP